MTFKTTTMTDVDIRNWYDELMSAGFDEQLVIDRIWEVTHQYQAEA